MKPHNPRNLCLLLLLPAALLACGGKEPTALQQTLTPLSGAVRQTATARAGEEGRDEDLATAQADVNEQEAFLFGTQTAVATRDQEAHQATATAAAPALQELAYYGVDPGEGFLAWMQGPLVLSLPGAGQTATASNYAGFEAADFVLAADLTWNMPGSLERCGLLLRSDGEDDPSQYLVLLERAGSGAITFLMMQAGELAGFQVIYPGADIFNWQNGATNRLAVAARGSLLELYTNGVFAGHVDLTQPPPAQLPQPPEFALPGGAGPAEAQDHASLEAQRPYAVDFLEGQLEEALKNYDSALPPREEGYLAFIAMSQAGAMTCTVDDAWLFVIR